MRIAALQLAGKTAAALPLLHVGAAAGPRALRAQLLPRVLLGAAAIRCVVVLDNFHEARTSAEQRAAFAHGLEEIPEGITVIVDLAQRSAAGVRAARREPPDRPDRRGRARAARPTKPRRSSAAIELDAQTCSASQRQSDGWVAALVLLARAPEPRTARRSTSRSAKARTRSSSISPARSSTARKPENQRVLMLTAIPPSFTQAEADRAHRQRGRAAAARLPLPPPSFHRPAPRRADDLSLPRAVPRVPARGGADAAVGRRAARSRARARPSSWPRAGRRATRSRSSATPANGRRCAALIRANALDWARQGRAQTLSDWIEALPAGDARGRSMARILVRSRVDLRRAAARPSGARARLRGVPRRRRSARPGARAQHDRHRLLLRVGEFRAARSLAAGVRAPARPRTTRRRSIAKASCARAPRMSDRAPVPQAGGPASSRRARNACDELIDGEERPQRADDGRLDAVQLHQLEDRRATRPTALVARIEPILARPRSRR